MPPLIREETTKQTLAILISILVSQAASTPMLVTETDQSIIRHLPREVVEEDPEIIDACMNLAVIKDYPAVNVSGFR